MKRNIWIALFTLVIAMLLIVACSKEPTTPDNGDEPTEEQLQQLDDIRQKQLEYYTGLENLLSEMDTASAKDSIVATMSSDTLIEWAIVTSQGINIQWEAGFAGTLLLDPKRSYSGDLDRATGRNRSSIKSHTATGSVCPKSKKTLYLSAFYTEFGYWEDEVIDSANAVFAQAGYDNFEVYKNAECTFSWFNTMGLLDDYGIIRISSHGNIWPSEADIQSVYLWTGETVNRSTDLTIYDYLASGLIHMGTRDSSTYYTIDGAFFAAANDFTYEKSFISLGFCYGALGNWPTDLVNFSGASAVTAYSWAVWDSADAVWTEDFFGQMCDTTLENPLTIGEWDSGSDRLYYDTEYSRWVALLYSGADTMTLWKPFNITSITPTSGMEDTIVTIEGVGFGNTEAQVRFGTVVATDISAWSDTLIRVAVPAGLAEGIVIVKVVVDGSETNGVEFTIGSAIDLSVFTHITIRLIFVGRYHNSAGGSWDDDFDLANYTGEGTDHFDGSFSGNTFYGYYTEHGETEIETEVTITVDPIAGELTGYEFTRTENNVGFTNVLAFSCPVTNIPMHGNYYGPGYPICFTLNGTGVCNHISDFERRYDRYVDSSWEECTGYYCNEESAFEINFYDY